MPLRIFCFLLFIRNAEDGVFYVMMYMNSHRVDNKRFGYLFFFIGGLYILNHSG